MEIIPIRTEHGEEKSWDALCGLERAKLAREAGLGFDGERFTIESFGMPFHVDPCERLLKAADGRGELMVTKYRDFFRLSVLWYLSSAKDIPETGRFLRPVDVKGGQRFSAGTHLLPLDQIAERFGRDRAGFIAQAARFGGVDVGGYGDACVRLRPLPRVPVTMVLWLEDSEDDLQPRVDLFFDSTVDFQLGLSDIVWSVGVMTALIMLEP